MSKADPTVPGWRSWNKMTNNIAYSWPPLTVVCVPCRANSPSCTHIWWQWSYFYHCLTPPLTWTLMLSISHCCNIVSNVAVRLAAVWDLDNSWQHRRTWCCCNSSSTHWAARLNINIKLTLYVQMSVVKLIAALESACRRLRVWPDTILNYSGLQSITYIYIVYLGLRYCIKFLKSLSSMMENGWSSNAMNSMIVPK